MTKCLSKLADFKQKENANIEAYYDRMNDLIFKCNQYGLNRTSLEFNLTFVYGLRKEWRNMCLMIKTQENFDTHSLSNLYNILKTHESGVMEITEENKMKSDGPMTLVSKANVKEYEFEGDAKEDDEGFLLNSYDEAVCYYSNNRVKKFFKKPISENF